MENERELSIVLTVEHLRRVKELTQNHDIREVVEKLPNRGLLNQLMQEAGVLVCKWQAYEKSCSRNYGLAKGGV